MCSIHEHSDRSARERAAQQQEPIYTELAAEYGVEYQPAMVADGKSAARSFLDQTAYDRGGFLPSAPHVVNTTGKPIVILPWREEVR